MDRVPEGARRIAFFGGSFDPPHLGHLAVARAARAALELDAVLFAPVGAQPLKARGATAGFEDRLAMTRLAIADEPGFMLSLADAPNSSGAPNYTIDTLLRLRAELPVGGELFCLMGADSFLSLRRWHRAAEIPFAASLIVASRPATRAEALRGSSLEILVSVLPQGLAIERANDQQTEHPGAEIRAYTLRNAAGQTAEFYLLPGLHVEISATDIREQVRADGSGGTAAREVLPAAVADYIRQRGLYN
jgi:nicotinate-nucleotide adenylyltransferase